MFPDSQISFPVNGNFTIIDLNWALNDQCHGSQEPVGSVQGGAVWCSPVTAFTQWGDKVTIDGTFRAHVDLLIDSFLTHTHSLVMWEVFDYQGSNLLR